MGSAKMGGVKKKLGGLDSESSKKEDGGKKERDAGGGKVRGIGCDELAGRPTLRG